MESIGHGPLKSRSKILRLKGIFLYAKVHQGQIKVFLCWSLGWVVNLLYPKKISMKEKITFPAHSSIIWSIKGVGKLYFIQASFKSINSMRMWIVPYFLSTRTEFETHLVNETGFMKLALSIFSPLALIATVFLGFTDLSFYRIGLELS